MTTRWKSFAAILIFLIVDIAAGYTLYTKAWTKIFGENLQVPFIKHAIQPTPQDNATKMYSYPHMHISFSYPKTLTLKQINPSLISIENSANISTDSSLYIFETKITTTQETVDIPFVIKGKIKNQVAIPLHNFTAKQITYTDGLILITLRKDQQFIMVRIPKNSKYVEDAITDFVDTVKLLP